MIEQSKTIDVTILRSLRGLATIALCLATHCMKNVWMQSFFWPVFSCIRTEHGIIWTRENFVLTDFQWVSLYRDTICEFNRLKSQQNYSQYFPPILKYLWNHPLCEKCPNTELFLLRIWTHFTLWSKLLLKLLLTIIYSFHYNDVDTKLIWDIPRKTRTWNFKWMSFNFLAKLE